MCESMGSCVNDTAKNKLQLLQCRVSFSLLVHFMIDDCQPIVLTDAMVSTPGYVSFSFHQCVPWAHIYAVDWICYKPVPSGTKLYFN